MDIGIFLTKQETMKNTAIRTVTEFTQTYNIWMTKQSYFPYTSTYSSTRHNTNRKHILQHSKTKKNTIFNNGLYTTNIPIVTYNRYKNKHTPYTVRLIVTTANNKILRTPPPHISSSEEILLCLTRCTLAQPRTIKFFKVYVHKFDAKTHPSPLCSFCNNHTHHLLNCTHICTTVSPPDLWTDPAGASALVLARLPEKLAGGPEG